MRCCSLPAPFCCILKSKQRHLAFLAQVFADRMCDLSLIALCVCGAKTTRTPLRHTATYCVHKQEPHTSRPQIMLSADRDWACRSAWRTWRRSKRSCRKSTVSCGRARKVSSRASTSRSAGPYFPCQVAFRVSDLNPQTSDIRSFTPDIRYQTLDMMSQTPDLRPQTSDLQSTHLKTQTSNLSLHHCTKRLNPSLQGLH